MQVKINGKSEKVEETTLSDLLQSRAIEPRMVTVEYNSKMLDKSAFSKISLKDGDEIEFLYFMGGGSNTPK